MSSAGAALADQAVQQGHTLTVTDPTVLRFVAALVASARQRREGARRDVAA